MAKSSSFSKHIATEEPVEQIYRRGSTCDTYIVRRLGKLHFEKKLKAEYKDNTQYILAFRKEFEVGYRLEHPALPRYIAIDEDDGCPYILEEYIEGMTLTDFISGHPDYFHNRRNAKTLIDELLSVMAYLHDHQILFLDLKPDNIMITSVGHHLKLVDLGGCLTDDYRDTEAMSPDFAAPEQLDSKDKKKACLDERTDIFLIGRLLQYAQLPSLYSNVIAHCLRDSPEARYQNVADLQRAVKRVRRRHIVLKLSLLGAILIVCISLSINYIAPKERQGATKETATSIVPKHDSNKSKAIDSLSKTGMPKQILPHMKDVGKENRQPSSGANNITALTAELHKNMDRAYLRYFAVFTNDTVIPARDFYAMSDKYTAEVNASKERLGRKYPTAGKSEIEAKYMEYFNKTVLPLWDKVDKKAWK